MESWYWTELPKVNWVTENSRPVSGLGDMTVMTVSQATARQPSLITPLNSLLSVLDLTGEIINFVITSGQGSDISQMTIAV